MTSTAIREAQAGDQPQVLELLGSLLGEQALRPPVAVLKASVEKLLHRPDLGRILVATVGDEIVGVAVVSFAFALEHGGRTAWLDELYVNEVRRGQGMGSTLLRAACELAASQGAQAVDLEIEPSHARASRLYERHGFSQHQRQRWFLQFGSEIQGSGTDTSVRIRPLVAEDAPRVRGLLERRWGGVEIVSKGRRHDASCLPGFLALDAGNEPCGLLTWRTEGDQREVVTLDAFPPGLGTGSALLRVLEEEAQRAGVRRMWVITTNDNVSAIAFYQRVGWRLYAVHRDALAEARRLKPSIPLNSTHGVPIRDEVELERVLDA